MIKFRKITGEIFCWKQEKVEELLGVASTKFHGYKVAKAILKKVVCTSSICWKNPFSLSRSLVNHVLAFFNLNVTDCVL